MTSNINQTETHLFFIPNQIIENEWPVSSTYDGNVYQKVCEFTAYPSKGGIRMNIMVRKRRVDDNDNYFLYFGLQMVGMPDGMRYDIHHSFSLIRSGFDHSNLFDGRGEGIFHTGLDQDEEQILSDLENNRSRIFSRDFHYRVEGEGVGPFGMSDSPVKNWGICHEGYMVLELRIFHVLRKPSTDFYLKMAFEKAYPEYVASEIGQLRREVTELRLIRDNHSEMIRKMEDDHRKSVTLLKEQVSKATDVEQELSRDLKRAREDHNVLQKRIDSLEQELSNTDLVVKSKEFIQSLQEVVVEDVSFSGTIVEKQELQVKMTKLMIKLAASIKLDSLCSGCKKKPRNMAFKPCGHFYWCSDCYQKDSVHLCPLCTHEIENTITVDL